MSDDNETPEEERCGYGRPPVEHQFKKGASGNVRGRKPKRERSLLPRQLRADILKVAQTPMRIKTVQGEREVTAYEAVLISMVKKALSGQYSSGRHFLELCAIAAQQHYDTHHEFRLLEGLERRAVLQEHISRDEIRQLNKLRKATRKT